MDGILEFIKMESGTAAVEYSILVTFIALLLMGATGAFHAFCSTLTTFFDKLATELPSR